MKSLDALRYVTKEPRSSQVVGVTAEAEDYIENGSPEAQFYNAVPAEGGISRASLRFFFLSFCCGCCRWLHVACLYWVEGFPQITN